MMSSRRREQQVQAHLDLLREQVQVLSGQVDQVNKLRGECAAVNAHLQSALEEARRYAHAHEHCRRKTHLRFTVWT
jgi:prefoldin subunit 5